MNKPCIKDGVLCETYSKYPKRCEVCFNQAFYVPVKQKIRKKYTGKNSSRMGAKFEQQNHESNQKLFTSSNMTPNSGAGKIKGDEQISGLVHVMEELKTHIKPMMSRGSETFTIRKEWLEKLHREASAENKEFWYLKFRFNEIEPDTYVVLEQDMVMSMVKTMVEDRKKQKLAQHQIDLALAKAEYEAAENAKLRAEVRLKEREIQVLYDEMGKENPSNRQEDQP